MTVEMSGKIRWLRVKQAAEKVACRPVSIHGSTDLPSHLRTAVDATEEHVDIALNFQHVKSAEDVLAAVAHELAHAVAGTSYHGERFEAVRKEIKKRLMEDYYRF